MAILLDTSSSMTGLIDQARARLWAVVNELATAQRDGQRPQLQLALYEYGHSTLPAQSGYIRQIIPFTADLDRISEELFALGIAGGDEYCGQVLQEATADLEWSRAADVLKLIFIAGNESFNQGSVDFKQACQQAITKGVQVNTIYCGNHDRGISEHWQEGALLADGAYLSIDHNQVVTGITAPQDDEIARLGSELNQTYIPYGSTGSEGFARQQAQDSNVKGTGAANHSSRVQFKASAAYVNTSWDLVDAVREGTVRLAELDRTNLPEELQAMTVDELKQHVEDNDAQRSEIRGKIARLSQERAQYIAEQRREQAESDQQSLDQAMIEAIRTQGAAKQLSFE